MFWKICSIRYRWKALNSNFILFLRDDWQKSFPVDSYFLWLACKNNQTKERSILLRFIMTTFNDLNDWFRASWKQSSITCHQYGRNEVEISKYTNVTPAHLPLHTLQAYILIAHTFPLVLSWLCHVKSIFARDCSCFKTQPRFVVVCCYCYCTATGRKWP